jgi:lipopolysaccharide export system protein LptC
MTWPNRAWHKLQIYFPLLLLAIVAIGTYLMAHSTKSRPKEFEKSARSNHNPDYLIQNLFIKKFDKNGRLTTEILGISAKHFPDKKILSVQQIRAKTENEQGEITTISAEVGNLRDDQTILQLVGNAHIVRTPPSNVTNASLVQYWGNDLTYHLTTQQVTSVEPVQIQNGLNRFSSNTMQYNNKKQQMKMQGRVHVTIPQQKQNSNLSINQ